MLKVLEVLLYCSEIHLYKDPIKCVDYWLGLLADLVIRPSVNHLCLKVLAFIEQSITLLKLHLRPFSC